MNGKTDLKKRRRLTVVVLAASLAAVAVPAATAGGGYEAGLVAGRLGSPDPRDTAREKESFSPSIVDRMIGSRDPRDSEILVLNVPSMNEVLLHESGQERGSRSLPRADDRAFREIVQGAAQEHGAAGFENTTRVTRGIEELHGGTPDSHLPAEDRP